MKKLITAILMVMAAVTAYAFPFDKYSLNRSDLPQEAQEFLLSLIHISEPTRRP